MVFLMKLTYIRTGEGVVCMVILYCMLWTMARFSVMITQQKDKLKNLTAAIDNIMQSGISLAEDVMVSSVPAYHAKLIIRFNW